MIIVIIVLVMLLTFAGLEIRDEYDRDAERRRMRNERRL